MPDKGLEPKLICEPTSSVDIGSSWSTVIALYEPSCFEIAISGPTEACTGSTCLTYDDTIVHFPPFPCSTRRNKSKPPQLALIVYAVGLAQQGRLVLTSSLGADQNPSIHSPSSPPVSQCCPFVNHAKVQKNVHHAGQPMPGEEQEDIVMTTTQSNLLNVTCPLSGKPVTELAEPVRSVECKHVYEKKVVMVYIRSNARQCPVAGCPKILRADKIVCDPLLLIEIEEMRAMSKQSAPTSEIEDCTALDEEEDD
uniref:SP-RING-type domain-containing protein n=1 Tax=Quercus lobata TaxID=97700 RepID=A0A7N2MAX9_QUELO